MTPEEQWLLQREKALAWLRAGFALVAILANVTALQRFLHVRRQANKR